MSSDPINTIKFYHNDKQLVWEDSSDENLPWFLTQLGKCIRADADLEAYFLRGYHGTWWTDLAR